MLTESLCILMHPSNTGWNNMCTSDVISFKCEIIRPLKRALNCVTYYLPHPGDIEVFIVEQEFAFGDWKAIPLNRINPRLKQQQIKTYLTALTMLVLPAVMLA